uniref:Core shell protein Gag P30 domain-containing protein n=1 Tax=Gopherus agassizii TaxID=38772 RepID=A0A452H6N9_9SAUR
MGKDGSKCPGDAPLSLILRDWKDKSRTARLSKAKMRDLCWIQWPSFTFHLSPTRDWPECGTFSTDRMNSLRDILVDLRPGQMDYLFVWYNYKPTEGRVAIEAVCMQNSCKNPPPYPPEPHREEDDFVPVLPPVRRSARIQEQARDSSRTEENKGGAQSNVPSSSERSVSLTLPAQSSASLHQIQKESESMGENAFETGLTIQAPLRTDPVLLVAGAYQMVFTHTSFATSDLLNWQRTMPRLRDNPEAVERMFRTIFSTHVPTWADVNQLLDTLMTEDERQRVKEKSAGHLDVPWPITDPNWDPNTPAGKVQLDGFLKAVLSGIRDAGEATPNWSKVTACVQRPDEHPSDFCARLICEVRKHGNLNHETDHGKEMVKMVIMSQCAEDIAKRFREHPDRMSLYIQMLSS